LSSAAWEEGDVHPSSACADAACPASGAATASDFAGTVAPASPACAAEVPGAACTFAKSSFEGAKYCRGALVGTGAEARSIAGASTSGRLAASAGAAVFAAAICAEGSGTEVPVAAAPDGALSSSFAASALGATGYGGMVGSGSKAWPRGAPGGMPSGPRRPCPRLTSSALTMSCSAPPCPSSTAAEKFGRREICPWDVGAAAEAAVSLGSTYPSACAHPAGLSSLPSPTNCASETDCPSLALAGASDGCTGGITGT
jgi:hypothetical protein